MMRCQIAALVVAGSLCVTACGRHSAQSFTLYRTSSIDRSLRVHWGTFDADESDPSYNLNNCQMAARLLTANMKALNGADYDVRMGFWCEPGGYSEKGEVPHSFPAAFPTDT